MVFKEKINITTQKNDEGFSEQHGWDIESIMAEYGKKIEFKSTREEIDEERNEVSLRDEILKEKIFDAKLLTRFVRRYCGVDIKIKAHQDDLYRIDVEEEAIDKLPNGYAYKGGAARAVLEKVLNINSEIKPRDIDIAYINDPQEEDFNLSEDLAEKYMPNDFKDGYGVEKAARDYFQTRDFTINEILYDGSSVVFTRECLLDTVRGIIRITDFERKMDKTESVFIKYKLLAKSIRFLSEKLVNEMNVRIANEDDIKFLGIDDFHMALHLDRAMEKGYEVAKKYLNELHRRNLIAGEYTNPVEAIKYFSKKLNNFVFQCTNVVKENKMIDRWDEYDEYEDLRANKSGFGRRTDVGK